MISINLLRRHAEAFAVAFILSAGSLSAQWSIADEEIGQLVASNAAGEDSVTLQVTIDSNSPDGTVRVTVKDKDGNVVDTQDITKTNSAPMTIPAGGKAYVTDLADEDTDGANGTATMTQPPQ